MGVHVGGGKEVCGRQGEGEVYRRWGGEGRVMGLGWGWGGGLRVLVMVKARVRAIEGWVYHLVSELSAPCMECV